MDEEVPVRIGDLLSVGADEDAANVVGEYAEILFGDSVDPRDPEKQEP